MSVLEGARGGDHKATGARAKSSGMTSSSMLMPRLCLPGRLSGRLHSVQRTTHRCTSTEMQPQLLCRQSPDLPCPDVMRKQMEAGSTTSRGSSLLEAFTKVPPATNAIQVRRCQLCM